jgi:D-lactate dehydrogenase
LSYPKSKKTGMRAVAYSVKPFEKEPLSVANRKKHDITLISNFLNIDTVSYAEGKDAVIVAANDDLTAPVINRLADTGVKYIATRSTGIDHIDRVAAGKRGMKIANVPAFAPHAIAEQAAALALGLARNIVPAALNAKRFDFRVADQLGFTFSGKTAGIMGMGAVGRAAASIFRGLGCRILGYDQAHDETATGYEPVMLDRLFAESDIITLHLPLTDQTRYIICRDTIKLMKPGMMLINTARGALIDTKALPPALESGRIAYLGLDVYESGQKLFYYDHSADPGCDPLLAALLNYPNVLLTPHQAFLTTEALQAIAMKTIANLDKWSAKKCVGEACACAVSCRPPALKSR